MSEAPKTEAGANDFLSGKGRDGLHTAAGQFPARRAGPEATAAVGTAGNYAVGSRCVQVEDGRLLTPVFQRSTHGPATSHHRPKRAADAVRC